MLGMKVYTTVIQDGSSKFVNREITGILDLMTKRRIGRTRCRKLDRNHPTTMVLKRLTTANRYREAKLMIEKTYPGYCAFNVTV